MQKKFIEPNLEAVSAAVAEIDLQLQKWNVKDEERIKATLALDDYLGMFVKSVNNSEKICLSLKRNYRRTSIHLSCRGEQVGLVGTTDADMELLNEEYGPEAANLINDVMQHFASEVISVSYAKGINRVRIMVHRNEKAMIYDTAIALVLAIVSAIVLRLTLPAEAVAFIAKECFSPLYEIFIRCIMTVVGPMVFFSLAACVANLKDIGSLGRAGIKIVFSYLFITCCSLLIVLGFNSIFHPGVGVSIDWSQTTSVASEKMEDTSILKMLIDIIPDNFLGSFVNSDMLQILVLGIAVGIACSGVSKYTVKLREGIDAMDYLVQKLIRYAVSIMPIAVFGAVGNMVCTLDIKMFGVVCTWFVVTLLILLTMQVVYPLLLFIFARLKPTTLFPKIFEAQLTAMSTGSSCATIPVAMKCCEKLGISPRLYNFSIPLGASINMDGISICLSMTGLFLATLCGIQLDGDAIISFFISVVMLSMAAPGVPGGLVAMLLIVVVPLGIPSNAVAMVMGLMPFFELALAASDVTGDMTVGILVANSENLLDKKQFYAKSGAGEIFRG